MVEIAAHFDPYELSAGMPLKVRIEESEDERKARTIAAIRAFGELGRGGVQLPDKYLDERETYYDDDHRAGLD